MLGLLDHPDFIWIPISLEEILRVSGMVGLSQKEGLFSTKTLGKSGVTSDDLLFMGIEVNSQTININLLPIEVKVGINSSVENKAINQVKHTSKILNEFLTEENENEFMRNYYINLFISIMVTNLNKMISSNLYTKYDEIKLHNIINKLKAGEFIINNNIVDYYGDGVVFKFTEG